MKQKLYFESIDSTTCYSLQDHLCGIDELEKQITLLEAVPDNDNPDYIFCSHYGEVGDRGECKKSICPHYNSKSGRGVCANRGHLYLHGESVTFQIPGK